MVDGRIERLLFENRFDEVLDVVSLADIARTWMRYQHVSQGDRARGIGDDDFWAVDLWQTADWWSNEARVREGILALVDAADTDLDFDVMAAAIVEVFITADEDRIRWLEDRARESIRFRRALANVWIWDEPEWVFQRVEAAARTKLRRPTT